MHFKSPMETRAGFSILCSRSRAIKQRFRGFEGRWKVVEGEAKGMRAELDTQKKVVDSLKKALAGSGWDEEKEKSAEISLREVRKRVNELQEVELVVILFRPAC